MPFPLEKEAVSLIRRAVRYFKLFKTPIIWFCVIVGLAIGYKLVPVVILSNMKPPAASVSATPALEEKWADELQAIGTITATKAITIAPEVNGTVTGIHFESGAKIAREDKIISLNDSAERADLDRYLAQLEITKLTLERSKKLSTQKVESKADFDQKKANMDQAQALVDQAKATIAKKNITAPFSGVLGIRKVNLGDYLQAGTAVVTLTNDNHLFINFNIAERFADKIKTGQTIYFTVDAMGSTEFEGNITSIDPQISQDIRNVSIQATAENKEGKLKSGMFATIRIVLSDKKPTITIPETAIEYGLYGSSVYIIDQADPKNMTVKKSFIKTGANRKGRVAILSGMTKDDLIVTAGQLKLNNGAAITLSDDPVPTIPETTPKP